MSKRGYIIFSMLLLLGIQTSGRQRKTAGEERKAAVAANTKRYIFRPEIVYPVGKSARQLTPGFELRFSKDSLFCYLPYIGRAFNIDYASRDNVLNFTTTDFEFTLKEAKKKEQSISLKPQGQREIREMNITLYADGYADVQVFFNQRQNIAYRGQMTVEDR